MKTGIGLDNANRLNRTTSTLVGYIYTPSLLKH